MSQGSVGTVSRWDGQIKTVCSIFAQNVACQFFFEIDVLQLLKKIKTGDFFKSVKNVSHL